MSRRAAAPLVCALVAALAAQGAPRVARAADEGAARPVIVFASPDGEPLAARIEAELLAAGLMPRRVTIAGVPSREELAAIVDASRAEGAIRIDGAAGAEVWIVDPTTGRTRLRQSLTADPSPSMTAVIALRTVEFLRASLLPTLAPPRPAPEPPAIVTATPASPQVRGLRVALAPAWIMSAGGVSGGLSAALAIAVPLGARFGVEGLGVVPLVSGRLDAPEGATRLSAFLAGAGASLRVAHGRHWSSDLALGALAAVVRVSGDPRAPYVGQSESMTGVAPYLRAGGVVGLGRWLALRADVLVGTLLPRAVVDVGTRDAATWGRPLGAVLLGLQGGGV